MPTIVGSWDLRAGDVLLNYTNDSAGPPSLSLGTLLLRNGTDQGFTGSGSVQAYLGDDLGSLRFGIDTYTHARDPSERFKEDWAVPHHWRDRSLNFRDHYLAGEGRGETELNHSVMFLSFASPEGMNLRMDYYDDYAMGQHPIHDGKLITKAHKEVSWTDWMFRDQALDGKYTGGEPLPLPRFEYTENPGISFTLGYDLFPLK